MQGTDIDNMRLGHQGDGTVMVIRTAYDARSDQPRFRLELPGIYSTSRFTPSIGMALYIVGAHAADAGGL